MTSAVSRAGSAADSAIGSADARPEPLLSDRDQAHYRAPPLLHPCKSTVQEYSVSGGLGERITAAMLEISRLMARGEMDDAVPQPGGCVDIRALPSGDGIGPVLPRGLIHLARMGEADDISAGLFK